ncbi:hypothetical protein MNBD_ACTINO02-2431 [hydrothermal vent metagenome]|uniref:RDD domain-containing protein n=1 Tax=hydrothermal vent metagenome TaxID=652676 RepID=A0A3B0S4G1_9ZZZZ
MGLRPVTIAGEEYVVATRWQRVGGAVIDSLILLAVSAALATLSGFDVLGSIRDTFSGETTLLENPPGWFAVGSFIIGAGYEIYFIGTRGQTPGKMVVGTRVVPTRHAGIPGFSVAGVRWMVPAAAGYLSGVGGGLLFWLTAAVYLPILFQEYGQGVHDMIAKTYVIKN